MSNPYYDSTGYPQTGASGSSASMRAEFDSIEAGFNKLPTLAGNGSKLVKINSAANALETSNVISENGINATISGDLTIAGGNVGVDADSLHTIPNVAADTLTLNAATQTLTNKTIVAASNTITTAAVGNLTSTNLNAALAELQADIDTRSTTSSLDSLSNALSNHINDTDDAHDASAISYAGATGMSATNVEAAIDELADDVLQRVSKTSDTGSAVLPVGTTAQRDSGTPTGYLRFNTTLNQFEGFNGTAWGAVGAGATGGAGNYVFFENDQAVTVDYTLSAGKNAVTAGPITINSGVTVTIPTGATWTIV